jgi:Nucleotidyl transferase AbiEii toxin, Type IV TA system
VPAAGELLRALAPVLQRFGDRWYVFGAQAVIVWGRPRLTGDVDVTAFLDPDDPDGFATAMETAGFDLRVRDVEGFVRRTRVFPFMHRATSLPLDIVLGGPGPEEEFARTARRLALYGVTVPVIGPEELVVTKILAGRPKDLDDVQGILRAQGSELDLGRVRGLLAELEAGLGQSDLLPVLEAQIAAIARPRS